MQKGKINNSGVLKELIKNIFKEMTLEEEIQKQQTLAEVEDGRVKEDGSENKEITQCVKYYCGSRIPVHEEHLPRVYKCLSSTSNIEKYRHINVSEQ